MVYSMTGYGRAEKVIGENSFLIEIKSLNGKQFDLRMQLTPLLKPFEFEIRSILMQELERGSIECSITIKQNGFSKPFTINTDLIKSYYRSVLNLADELGADKSNILSAILKLPEVVITNTEALSAGDFEAFKVLLKTAIANVVSHQLEEGRSIEQDMHEKIAIVEKQLAFDSEIEPKRREKTRDNLLRKLEEGFGKDSYDGGRLEQELIFYIEKNDISEEQVRIKNHIAYFKEVLKEEGKGRGKKLTFLLQEIAREVNTTGSKAFDANIQKCVVVMKDELEKVKEQALNML